MSVGRAHRFRSVWYLPHPPEQVWDVLAEPGTWPRWWPGLRATTVRVGDVDGVGTRGVLTFTTPLGYRLGLGLEVLEAAPPRAVVMRAVGDLRGRAAARLEASATGTVLTIDWHVRLARPSLVRLDAVAPWLARPSHAVVMTAGERGLRRHLRHLRDVPPAGRRRRPRAAKLDSPA